MFDFLPLAAVLGDKALSIHGGLSPLGTTLSEIDQIERVQEIPQEGTMCDILWSDPTETQKGWNLSTRGAGFLFGQDILERFLHTNKLDILIRSH